MQGVFAGMVSGVVQENGTPVAGKTVLVLERATGKLLNSGVTNGSGNFQLDAAGRSSVIVVVLDSPYNAIVYDNITPA